MSNKYKKKLFSVYNNVSDKWRTVSVRSIKGEKLYKRLHKLAVKLDRYFPINESEETTSTMS